MATLESALSSATSSELLRSLLENTVSDNLAGNQDFIKKLVTASLRNGNSIGELRAEIVTALAGTVSKSAEAVRKLVGFATGSGASLGTQKDLLVALEAESVKKSSDVLSTARAWQSVFDTREDVVEGTIAALIGAATGAVDEDSRIVAAAAFSPAALKAGDLLLSGSASEGPLRTALATAQIDSRIATEMKKTAADVYGGELPKLKDAKRYSMNKGELAALLDNVYDIQQDLNSLKDLNGKVRDAKKTVDEPMMAAVDDARKIAGSAATIARRGGAAAAQKASYSAAGKY